MPNLIATILQTKGRKVHSVEPETSVFNARRLESPQRFNHLKKCNKTDQYTHHRREGMLIDPTHFNGTEWGSHEAADNQC